ncbi:MAG: Ribosome-binding ATPase YchF [Syntrophorhabdus sp. PtaB.Bin047]|jgi:GTP-binding protein YchF|nr:MAG: Ribosome-binding ATPase YchF [Syntrophorhabdus sp. PtaB.Bin047]
MYISVIGPALTGKTTLFQALSGVESARGFSDGDNIISIDVPDARVDELTRIYRPKKTTYARIELADTVAISEGNVKDSTINAKTLQKMRMSDAFILTLNSFEGAAAADIVKEFNGILNEFILADMILIEGRIERIRKQAGKKENTTLILEEELLERCLAHVGEGKPLRTLELAAGNEKALRGFRFLSQKPMMIAINCSEDGICEMSGQEGSMDGCPVIYVCASLECELAMMEDTERAAFMEEFSVKESIRGRMIRLAFDTLGLISFLTVGEDECRAWPIRKGMNAQEAAGAIHTDLASKFIRAETVSYADFMKYGGMAECKKAGVWRLEGKTYIVEDGDIISIRAGA